MLHGKSPYYSLWNINILHMESPLHSNIDITFIDCPLLTNLSVFIWEVPVMDCVFSKKEKLCMKMWGKFLSKLMSALLFSENSPISLVFSVQFSKKKILDHSIKTFPSPPPFIFFFSDPIQNIHPYPPDPFDLVTWGCQNFKC